MSECYASKMFDLAKGEGRLEKALAKVKKRILSEAKDGKFSLEINFDKLDKELFEDQGSRWMLLLLLRKEGFYFNEWHFKNYPHYGTDIRWNTDENGEKL